MSVTNRWDLTRTMSSSISWLRPTSRVVSLARTRWLRSACFMDPVQKSRIFVEDPLFEFTEGGRRVKSELFAK